MNKDTVQLIAAGIILLLYFTIAAVMIAAILPKGIDTTAWTQVVAIFNAIGGLATTAAGVLLGVNLQNRTVDAVTQTAKTATDKAVKLRAAAHAALIHLDTTDSDRALADTGTAAARTTLRTVLL